MKIKNMKALIALTLVFCMLFSACSQIELPYDFDDFFEVEETPAPEVTVVPTTDPLKERVDYGVVEISDVEDLLRVYYGLTFEESGNFDAVFEMGKSEYEFSPIAIGVTSDISNAIVDGKITVSASVSAYDPLGNRITTGVTSNMISSARSTYFGTTDYIHGMLMTYPGTYYVAYTVIINEGEESYGVADFDAYVQTYTINRIYVVDKVDAYIQSVSDFYFVQVNGADVRDNADITITTIDGWDIYTEVTDDISDTSRVTISVPKITVEVSEANAYELDIVGQKGGEDVDDDAIISKYFDLHLENGYRYIIPAEDEVNVQAVYSQLTGVGIDRYFDAYDFSAWDDYLAVLESYQNLTATEKMLFDLYPAYKLKYDNNFSYNDYYDMRAAHDWLMFIQYDSERAYLGEQLADLLASYQKSYQSEDFQALVDFITDLDAKCVYISGLIYTEMEHYDSDLAFAVKYAFNGKFENDENGYINIVDFDGLWEIPECDLLINRAVFANEYKFEMYSGAAAVIAAISRGDADLAVQEGEAYYEKYIAYQNVLGSDEYSLAILELISQYMTFDYDSKYGEYYAQATAALSAGEIKIAEIDEAFAIIRECLYISYEGLCDFQLSTDIVATFAISISACESFMLRYDAIAEVLAAAEKVNEESLESSATSYMFGDSFLIYNSETGVAMLSGENNIVKNLLSCSIVNMDSLKEAFLAVING